MELKFICCSDTHDRLPPDLSDEGVTAWLHAGDIYNNGFRHRGPNPHSGQRKLLAWLDSKKMPVLAVRGNHDCSFRHEFIDKCDAGGKCVALAPKLWGLGVGWAGGAYYDLPTERDLRSICASVEREVTLKAMPGDSFILLTHYPPMIKELYTMHGNPEGWVSESVKELVDKFKPMVVVQGHIHHLFGLNSVYEGNDFSSMIVSPGPNGGYLYIDPEAATARFEFVPKTLPSGFDISDAHGLTDFV